VDTAPGPQFFLKHSNEPVVKNFEGLISGLDYKKGRSGAGAIEISTGVAQV
jgi:hypothetical protein